MKIDTVQPISLDEPPQIVSDNLLKFLEEINQYKEQYINTDTLKNKNPIQLKELVAKFRNDAKIVTKVIQDRNIPSSVPKELYTLLEILIPILDSIGRANTAIPKHWIKILLIDFPFTQNTEHIMRLHENSTRQIDTNDGDSVSDTEDEW